MSAKGTPDCAIVAEHLVKKFGDFAAVRDVSFSVRGGEIMGFLGPNGAGKSTMMRIFCGLLTPSSGRAVVAGVDVARNPGAVRSRIGYMSQKFSLYADLTVEENLSFFAEIYQVPPDSVGERIARAVDMAGLRDHRSALVATLAAGWKQRLALGCAILHRPQVVFLDEPTSGVDPEARRRFWDLIHATAAEGVTVLVSTHYMDEAEYCNRIALIDAGQLVALGTPRELRQDPRLSAVLVVECPNLVLAMSALEAAQGVQDVAVFGNALHVTVADAARATMDLASLLRERGIECSRLERTATSLEDSFVQLVGRKARGQPVTS